VVVCCVRSLSVSLCLPMHVVRVAVVAVVLDVVVVVVLSSVEDVKEITRFHGPLLAC